MATPTSPKPIYHSPDAVGSATRQRRSSSRVSFTSSLALQPPMIESPRTLCPRDDGSFSYNPSHLPVWYVPQELWVLLPSQLQSALTAVQHAGAAVLTGFERLDKHDKDLNGRRPSLKADEDELLQLESLPPPKDRSDSNASSVLLSDISPSVFTGSPNGGFGTPSTSFSASQTTSPVSPICLTPEDALFPAKRTRTSEHSFSTPLEPHDAYYANELSHLRTEAVPRLYHASRKVDTEWYETKRTCTLTAEEITNFENWWAETKCAILRLKEKGTRLSDAIGLSSNGIGWTAP